MVEVTVRTYDGQRQAGQFFHEGAQIAEAGHRVDQQRALAPLDKITIDAAAALEAQDAVAEVDGFEKIAPFVHVHRSFRAAEKRSYRQRYNKGAALSTGKSGASRPLRGAQKSSAPGERGGTFLSRREAVRYFSPGIFQPWYVVWSR
ncbi:hypothetical protein RAH42_12695 [Pyramidobacter sp. YE332]|uniref:hypothetical protein n=1 Tax=Pyramidobacter sp. YE332 TaxID=3068894 RepID=UPI00294B2415|nr:hypothetical protein [Pyramidobacter sp. YE332]WOL39978.1 hypothetical protein RAH42_12695 [Pyramidobacter sp. YE332]